MAAVESTEEFPSGPYDPDLLNALIPHAKPVTTEVIVAVPRGRRESCTGGYVNHEAVHPAYRLDTLAAKVRAARDTAKHGDIFTPTVRPAFRRLLAPPLKGKEGADAKAVLRDDAPAPGTVPFKVNAPYPDDQPRPTVPASLLLTLPTLPEPLEYRIVGQHRLLLDTEADLIVDYILNAITT